MTGHIKSAEEARQEIVEHKIRRRSDNNDPTNCTIRGGSDNTTNIRLVQRCEKENEKRRVYVRTMHFLPPSMHSAKHYETLDIALTIGCLLHVAPRDESVLGRRTGLQDLVGLAGGRALLMMSLLEIDLLLRFFSAQLPLLHCRRPGVEFHR